MADATAKVEDEYDFDPFMIEELTIVNLMDDEDTAVVDHYQLGFFVDAAKQNGYDFTPEELLAAFSERSQPDVRAALDEKELLAVAGGSRDDCHADFWCPELNYYTEADKHDNCSDSFIDKENCWHNDGCDTAYNIYDDYECKGTGNCEIAFIHR